jgi:hypothetical protein
MDMAWVLLAAVIALLFLLSQPGAHVCCFFFGEMLGLGFSVIAGTILHFATVHLDLIRKIVERTKSQQITICQIEVPYLFDSEIRVSSEWVISILIKITLMVLLGFVVARSFKKFKNS